MSTPILSTKLYIPSIRPNLVPRPRLIEQLNEGLTHTPSMTLISAPAGFGKTMLVSDWLWQSDLAATWLSLDDSDNDPTRFLAYCVAALQQVDQNIGQTVLGIVQPPHPPPIETLITGLINDIATMSTQFVLVLDDYHVIKAKLIHDVLTFLLDHLPPQMHLVIASGAGAN